MCLTSRHFVCFDVCCVSSSDGNHICRISCFLCLSIRSAEVHSVCIFRGILRGTTPSTESSFVFPTQGAIITCAYRLFISTLNDLSTQYRPSRL